MLSPYKLLLLHCEHAAIDQRSFTSGQQLLLCDSSSPSAMKLLLLLHIDFERMDGSQEAKLKVSDEWRSRWFLTELSLSFISLCRVEEMAKELLKEWKSRTNIQLAGDTSVVSMLPGNSHFSNTWQSQFHNHCRVNKFLFWGPQPQSLCTADGCDRCTLRAAKHTRKCETGDSAKDASLPISRDLNHLEAVAGKVFDYCLMTESAFIGWVLSSVCLDLVGNTVFFGDTDWCELTLCRAQQHSSVHFTVISESSRETLEKMEKCWIKPHLSWSEAETEACNYTFKVSSGSLFYCSLSVQPAGPLDVEHRCPLLSHQYFLFYNQASLQNIWKSTALGRRRKSCSVQTDSSSSSRSSACEHLLEGIDCRLMMRSGDPESRHVIVPPESLLFGFCPVGSSWEGKLVASCTFFAISVCIHARHLIPTSAELLGGRRREAGCTGQLPDNRSSLVALNMETDSLR